MNLAEATTTTLSQRQGARSTRAVRGRAQLEERVVDYQAGLHEMGGEARRMASSVEAALEIDERDDLERYTYYQRLERAIRAGAPTALLLEAFHDLVTHVEADELREDQERVGLIPALGRLASRAGTLRSIFRADFVPRILASLQRPERP